MYQADTILKLKEQRDPDPETGEEFPYNRVRVVGPSPIDGAVRPGEWSGGDAQGVILTPLTNFGATIDEPFGKLRALYDVEHIPEVLVPVQTQVRVIDSSTAAAGPTPEEVFAKEAPGVPPEPGQTRARTPLSPLDDPRPAANDGPLGPAPKPRRAKSE